MALSVRLRLNRDSAPRGQRRATQAGNSAGDNKFIVFQTGDDQPGLDFEACNASAAGGDH